MSHLNPYSPTGTNGDDPAIKPDVPESIWLRNVKALVAVVVIYTMICAFFAISRRAMPELLFVLLIVLGSLGSAWANVPLGSRIGWNQGGLPVVIVIFFLALTAYSVAGLIAGGTLYGVLNPVTIYTPMRFDPDAI